jgi:Tfp pilus assembly protein PilF
MMQLRMATGVKPAEQPVLDHLELQPDDIFARRRLAEHYQVAGDRKQAVAQYEELVARAPRDPAAANNLAWLYYELGDARAESMARKASELAPENGAITDTLGWILVETNELDAGIELLRRAVEQAAQQPLVLPDIRYHLAAALARAGKTDEARRGLEELLKSDTSFQSRPQAEKLLKELSR